jgi:hypothetical protein
MMKKQNKSIVPVINPYGKKMSIKRNKKNNTVKTGKPPLPGERKALRKRIQLSNNNALPVAGLAELEPKHMLDRNNVGTMVELPGTMQDSLRALEAFKPTQFWPMFRQPAMLIRSETVDLISQMQEAANKKQMFRAVLTGERITGKSLLLLQSMAYGLSKEWIVINIPEGLPPTSPSEGSWTRMLTYFGSAGAHHGMHGIRRYSGHRTCAVHAKQLLPQDDPGHSKSQLVGPDQADDVLLAP